MSHPRGKNLKFSPPTLVPSPVEHYSHLVVLKTIEIPKIQMYWNPKTPKNFGHQQSEGTCPILPGLMVLATHQLSKLFCGKPWKHCKHQGWTKTESDFRRLSSITYFFKNLFYQNNCKEPMNIGGGQIRGALFNVCVVKMLFFVTSRFCPQFLK